MNRNLDNRLARFVALAAAALLGALPAPALWAVTLADTPLFLTTAGKANILIILDNSNSMDEAANGAAVGSDNAASKSEIARGVIKNLITTYNGKINMGLMAYKQNATSAYYLNNSPYDVSYNPVNYDPSYVGTRDSLTKRFRRPNATSAGNYIHYNIELPYYSSSSGGNQFCYSTTADFDNGSETFPSGPWDSYRCFSTKTGNSDVLPAWGDDASSVTPSEATQGYGTVIYWTPPGAYKVPFSATDSDVAQGILDFGRQLTSYYVARAWFRNDSPGRGYLHTPIKLLDATQATALTNKLKCNIPSPPAACNATGIKNAGLTPLEGTLNTARDYFRGPTPAAPAVAWNNASEGYVAACYPLPDSCGKNFVVLITDGLPSTNADGSVVTVPATGIAKVATAAAGLKTDKVETYVVGFALPYGVAPGTLNTIAAAGGTGTAYDAGDTASLTAALDAIFVDIITKVSSASSVATNSTQLDTDTKIYQARFDSGDWSGQLLAYPIKADGTLDVVAWDAGSLMPAHGARNITTFKPGTGGVNFAWTDLSVAQQTALDGGDGFGDERVDYLRGSDALEVKNGGPLRNRTRALGDIINSDPFYVGATSFSNQKLPGVEGTSYGAHVTAKATVPPMVYVGANDGMLHGFDADTGVERLAHVPNAVYDNLRGLTLPAYAHRYFVDGSPKAADAYFGGAWHTVLVEPLAGGGRAVFALDITDPTAHAASKVLWEYTDTDLGYPLGEASIVRMATGEWAAVFGNGYLSDIHRAVLYVVNIETGVLIKKIDTGAGAASPVASQNGLAAPTVVDTNNDRIADAAYAGDLMGNMWKFDLSGATAATWDVAYKTGTTNRPLFVTDAPDSTTQAITAKPAVGRHPAGGVVVLFGTGKYMELSDRIVPASPQVQTFYGLHDNGSRITSGRGALKQQKVVVEVSAFGFDLRLTTNYEPGPSDRGWFIDLPTAGERQVSRPVLRGGRIIFTTLIPSTATCSYGGTSWLMELDAITGSRLEETPFDLNGDGKFNSDDWVLGTGDFDGDGTPETIKIPVSGKKSKEGIIKTPAIIGAGEKEYKYASGTSGNVEVTVEPGGEGNGRQSWRQLQ